MTRGRKSEKCAKSLFKFTAQSEIESRDRRFALSWTSLSLSFKEIQNYISFVGFGEITLGGVERGTVRGMVEGGI